MTKVNKLFFNKKIHFYQTASLDIVLALISVLKDITAFNQNLFQLRPESDLSVIYKNNEGMKELHLSK